jgi:hypothetical protein
MSEVLAALVMIDWRTVALGREVQDFRPQTSDL